MAGKRQPTDIVKANGRKHMTKAEEDQRRDREVHVPPPDKAVPPKWLLKKYHKEFCEIGEILRSAGLYAELDRLLCRNDEYQSGENQASEYLSEKEKCHTFY